MIDSNDFGLVTPNTIHIHHTYVQYVMDHCTLQLQLRLYITIHDISNIVIRLSCL